MCSNFSNYFYVHLFHEDYMHMCRNLLFKFYLRIRFNWYEIVRWHNRGQNLTQTKIYFTYSDVKI